MTTHERVTAWIEALRVFGSARTSQALATELIELIYGGDDK